MEPVKKLMERAHELATAGMQRRAVTVYRQITAHPDASEAERETALLYIERVTTAAIRTAVARAARERRSEQRAAAYRAKKIAEQNAAKAARGEFTGANYNGSVSAKHNAKLNARVEATQRQKAAAAAAAAASLEKLQAAQQAHEAFLRVVAGWRASGCTTAQIATLMKRPVQRINAALCELEAAC